MGRRRRTRSKHRIRLQDSDESQDVVMHKCQTWVTAGFRWRSSLRTHRWRGVSSRGRILENFFRCVTKETGAAVHGFSTAGVKAATLTMRSSANVKNWDSDEITKVLNVMFPLTKELRDLGAVGSELKSEGTSKVSVRPRKDCETRDVGPCEDEQSKPCGERCVSGRGIVLGISDAYVFDFTYTCPMKLVTNSICHTNVHKHRSYFQLVTRISWTHAEKLVTFKNISVEALRIWDCNFPKHHSCFVIFGAVLAICSWPLPCCTVKSAYQ